jgi:hypothetical protein
MKRLRALLSVSLLLTFTTGALVGQAQAFNTFPTCDDPKVMAKIIRRFNWAEHKTWHRGIELDTIQRARHRATLAGGKRLINRRYCRGHARLSNGRHPTVHYLIEQRQGFASIGWNVEFCVVGHDRWHVYGGTCRVLRR